MERHHVRWHDLWERRYEDDNHGWAEVRRLGPRGQPRTNLWRRAGGCRGRPGLERPVRATCGSGGMKDDAVRRGLKNQGATRAVWFGALRPQAPWVARCLSRDAGTLEAQSAAAGGRPRRGGGRRGPESRSGCVGVGQPPGLLRRSPRCARASRLSSCCWTPAPAVSRGHAVLSTEAAASSLLLPPPTSRSGRLRKPRTLSVPPSPCLACPRPRLFRQPPLPRVLSSACAHGAWDLSSCVLDPAQDGCPRTRCAHTDRAE